jgi:hypothetical protein
MDVFVIGPFSSSNSLPRGAIFCHHETRILRFTFHLGGTAQTFQDLEAYQAVGDHKNHWKTLLVEDWE